MKVHFSADFGHSMRYHGEIDVEHVDNATVPLVWAKFRAKCTDWNLINTDCKEIEAYYIENDKEVVLKRLNNVK